MSVCTTQYAIKCYLLLVVVVVSESFNDLLQQLEVCYQLHSNPKNVKHVTSPAIILTIHEAAWYTISVMTLWRQRMAALLKWCVSIYREYQSSSYMKVIRCNKVDSQYSHDVKFPSAVTPVLHNIEPCVCGMEFLVMADWIVWLLSRTCDRKWPRITKCTHSPVVGLRLEGDLVITGIVLAAATVPPFCSSFLTCC